MTSSIEPALRALDRAIVEGRAEAVTGLFAPDAQFLFHHAAPIVGAAAIGQVWRENFAAADYSAYRPSYDVVDVHGDRAHVLGSFEELIRPRDGGPATRVHGRVVLFWRREADGHWRITWALTGRSAPDAPQP